MVKTTHFQWEVFFMILLRNTTKNGSHKLTGAHTRSNNGSHKLTATLYTYSRGAILKKHLVSDRPQLGPVGHPAWAVRAGQHVHNTFLRGVTHRQFFTWYGLCHFLPYHPKLLPDGLRGWVCVAEGPQVLISGRGDSLAERAGGEASPPARSASEFQWKTKLLEATVLSGMPKTEATNWLTVSKSTAHIRSGKIPSMENGTDGTSCPSSPAPFVMVTKCTEHNRSRKRKPQIDWLFLSVLHI